MLAVSGTIVAPGANNVGWLRICPHCGRWLALTPFRCELDAHERELCYYLCKYCSREVAFVQQARRKCNWI